MSRIHKELSQLSNMIGQKKKGRVLIDLLQRSTHRANIHRKMLNITVNREMHVKTTVRYYDIPTRMANIKTDRNRSW